MKPARQIVAGYLLITAVFVGAAAQPTGATPDRSGRPVRTWTLHEVPPCQEDEPCWDCATMGNHICGLTPTENATELLESTTLNGQELPATL